MQHGRFTHPFENKDNLFCVEVVSDLDYKFYSCVDIAVNRILTKIWAIGAVTLWFFWEFQSSVNLHHSGKTGHLVQWHRDCLFWESQTTEHHHNPTKSWPLVQWHCNCFSWCFKWPSIAINRFFLKSTCILSMGWMQIRFEWRQKIYRLDQRLC